MQSGNSTAKILEKAVTDVNDGGANSPRDAMTSGGAKYWNTGTVPLLAPEILGDIIANMADVGLVISEDGLVLSVLVNPNNRELKKLEDWQGKNIRGALKIDSVSKFDNRLEEFLVSKAEVRPLELNHSDIDGRWDLLVRYSFHRLGPEDAILMLGRDLRPIVEMQQQLTKAQLALEQDYEIQREYDTRFRVLMESTAEPIVFVSAKSAKITDANAAAADLLDLSREELVGTAFSRRFENNKRDNIVEKLSVQTMADQNVPISATLHGSGLAVRIAATMFRASGERMLLCRLLPEDAATTTVDDVSQNLQGLYAKGPEAMVFTSDGGEVLSANEAFLDLIDLGHGSTLRGRNLTDYLQRGSVDLKVMLENATRSGRMRMYTTKLAGEYGSPRAVEASVTKLDAGPYTVFGFVFRDATQAEVGREATNPTSDESMRSVVELVGSATLKDIVAETTNVVEKMCIETAVELTMNNRVATAEMLGLSRQSLYVKLRKFNLLSREAEPEN